VNESVVLVAGTKQSIPTGGIQLIDLVRNMGTNGTTAGAPISQVDRNVIDIVNSDWHSETGAATVKYFVFNPKDPTKFYVSPPQPSSAFGYVEMEYADTPDDPAGASSDITLDDIYEPVLIDLMLYYAYSVNADQSQYAWERSKIHWNNAVMALGRKDLKEKMDSPRPRGERAVQNQPI